MTAAASWEWIMRTIVVSMAFVFGFGLAACDTQDKQVASDDGTGGTINTAGGAGTGGTTSKGGSAGTGGTTNTGGSAGTGGTTSTGRQRWHRRHDEHRRQRWLRRNHELSGSAGTGGTTSTGGSAGAGGTTSTGGSAGSGGTTSTGGSAGSGGAGTCQTTGTFGSVVALAAPDKAFALTLSNDSVYWITNEATGAVKRVAKTGGAPEVLASNLAAPSNIVSDASFRLLDRWDVAPEAPPFATRGGAQETLTPDPMPNSGVGLAVSATSAYAGDDSIINIPLNGGTPQTLYSGIPACGDGYRRRRELCSLERLE